jgi:hypothetical protein
MEQVINLVLIHRLYELFLLILTAFQDDIGEPSNTPSTGMRQSLLGDIFCQVGVELLGGGYRYTRLAEDIMCLADLVG